MGDTSTPSGNESGMASDKTTASQRASALTRASQRMMALMHRRADRQSVEVRSTDASTLNIEGVDNGDVRVERCSLQAITTRVNTRRVNMNNVRTVEGFRTRVEWKVDVFK